MPRAALRRRFGILTLLRIDQALGNEEETIHPIIPIEPFRERLPCLEPIVTLTGIEIALERLLNAQRLTLNAKGMGVRKAVFSCFRVDNKIEQVEIGTNRATANPKHLFKLFEEKTPNHRTGPRHRTLHARCHQNRKDILTVRNNYGIQPVVPTIPQSRN